MRACELPDRQQLEQLARRYRIEGYEIDDLVQEAYLALLEAERDKGEWEIEDVEIHLRRLRRKETRRKPRIVLRLHPARDGDELADDNIRERTGGDIEALVLFIALQSLCQTGEELWLLHQLAEGSGYRTLCRDWRCNQSAARKRVSRFRGQLTVALEGE